jgi:hypothetical protein
MYCDDFGHCHNSIYAEKPKNVFQVREIARKKAIEMAVKRYFDGMEGAKNLRLYGNPPPKNQISNQQYQALVTLQKTELGRSLANLVRKGDTITIPPPD